MSEVSPQDLDLVNDAVKQLTNPECPNRDMLVFRTMNVVKSMAKVVNRESGEWTPSLFLRDDLSGLLTEMGKHRK